MRVLVTGHRGYIGAALVPMLQSAGNEVVGLDTYLFDDCMLGGAPSDPPAIRCDVRDVTPDLLDGFDGVIHLAGISNDPLGDLRPESTTSINHHGTVHLARAAKTAGVPRFLFSSSCSLYGAQGDGLLDEQAAFNPVTVYGWSKINAERELSTLADDDFSPTYLRNATAYGLSPPIRGDLVVNNLVGHAVTTGKVFLKSDGTPWRPLVHIEDISRAFIALLDAPREHVHDAAFNVGRTSENYQIREVAEMVEAVVPGSSITFADAAGPDRRNYRVSFEKIETTVPAYQPTWTVRAGIEQLYSAYRKHALTIEDLEGSRYLRVKRIQQLIGEGRLNDDMRWRAAAAAG